jgi:hypothetical protein
MVLLPIHLVKKKGKEKYRLVHDLREVNKAIEEEEQSFKMEHFLRVEKLLKKGIWATKIDVSSIYYHVSVNKDYTRLLSFKFQHQIYKFVTLPFGLKTAPRIFTKILYQMLKWWRIKNYLIIGYIDDILLLETNIEKLKVVTNQVVSDLKRLGWKVKEEKCKIIPQQVITFLGIQINLKEGFYQIPEV